MTTVTSWDDLSGPVANNTSAYSAADDNSITGVTGYIFDLFESDVSFTVDASFAQAILAGIGFAAVDAVASIDASAADFNNLFFITLDSSDVDDVSSADVQFSIEKGYASYSNPFGDISYSQSTVQSGVVNSAYGTTLLDRDLVRHVAREITGGYAAADIFSNEQALVDDVISRDVEVGNDISTIIDDISSAGRVTTAEFSGLNTAQERFFNIANTLFAINVANSAPGERLDQIYADLSAGAGYTTDSTASITVPLRFAVGEAIAIRVNYGAKESPAPGMGRNEIGDRSYKILIVLS